MDDTTQGRSTDRPDAPPPPNRRDEPGRSDLSEIARLLSGDVPPKPGTPGAKSRW